MNMNRRELLKTAALAAATAAASGWPGAITQ